MAEKRRDNKGRILRTGESQRKDGRYAYKYTDSTGKPQFVYAWKLVATDKTPTGKRDDISLREKEAEINRDIADGIDAVGKKMTVCQLYAKQNSQRADVKRATKKQREYLMRYSAAVDGMDEDIHAIYGSVNTAMDKWLPSEQWQRAEKLHLS